MKKQQNIALFLGPNPFEKEDKETKIKLNRKLGEEEHIRSHFCERNTSDLALVNSNLKEEMIGDRSLIIEDRIEAEDMLYERSEQNRLHIKIPRAIQTERFDWEEKLVRNQNIEVNIPRPFPFIFHEEAVLFGLLTLLSESDFGYQFVDKIGFFPGSKGSKVFYIPIPTMAVIYEAIGLRKKASRTYQDAEKFKTSFENLLSYRHPIEIRRQRVSVNGRGTYEYFCYLEDLFQICRCSKVLDKKDFLRLEMERRPGGGWRIAGGLRNLVILLNPKIFSSDIVRNFLQFDADLYRKVEDSRKRLSRGNGRGWKREALYLTFAYYLARQGGRFGQNENDVPYYRFERELGRLLEKLNLLDRYEKSPKDVMKVLNRTFEIYTDASYLLEFENQSSKRGFKRKIVFYLNVDAFPHLEQRSEALLADST